VKRKPVCYSGVRLDPDVWVRVKLVETSASVYQCTSYWREDSRSYLITYYQHQLDLFVVLIKHHKVINQKMVPI